MAEDLTQFETNIDVFKSYISLLDFDVNAPENQGWIQELFDLAKPQLESGVTADVVPDLLLKSGKAPAQFTQRFSAMTAANEAAVKAGRVKPFSTIESYFKAEQDYRSLFAESRGFEDLGTVDNIKTLISGGNSVVEIGDRIKNAQFAVRTADTALKNQIKKMFPSATDTDLARSLVLGNTDALTSAQKIGQAEILTEAETAGVSLMSSVEDLQKQGVTREKAREATTAIAASQKGISLAAKRFGESDTGLQQELEQQAFGIKESAKVKRLASQARAEFQKSSGVTTGSLGRSLKGNL